MLASQVTHLSLLYRGRSTNGFIKAIWDPVTAVLILVGVCWFYDETFDVPLILLSIIVFTILFPGNITYQRSHLGILREILVQWPLVLLVLFGLGYGTHYLDVFNVQVMQTWAVAVPVFWFLSHRLMPRIVPGLFAMEGIKTAVIVGTNQIGRQLASRFIDEKHLGVTFLGFFDDRSTERLGPQLSELLLGRVDNIADYVRHHSVDALFIALPMASQPRIVKLMDDLKDSTVSIYFVPDLFVTDLIQARVDNIDGIPVVAVRESPFNGFNGFVKRLSDIVIASVILVLLAPLMLGIAVAVKATSRGPVLFKQRRYGLDGKEIVVYKFRSMTVCEDGPVIRQAQKGDSRLTKIGGFLRRTSLDELPQFINVLQGSMSVVGPRPHAVAHNETYRRLIKGYMVRHKVKPGITGLAQVSGFRGETDTIEKMEKRIEYDLEYLRKWSLTLDFEIILRTISQVLRKGRAY
jgi:putative colanic acid biosynthesis UDP-glucose lipid carrier transferase